MQVSSFVSRCSMQLEMQITFLVYLVSAYITSYDVIALPNMEIPVEETRQENSRIYQR